MEPRSIVPQLRTTDLDSSIRFYEALGFELDFKYKDFYAGMKAGDFVLHLKRVDDPDPSIDFVSRGEHFHLYINVEDVDAAAEELRNSGVKLLQPPHDTDWGTRELVVRDDQGHTLYFGMTK